MEGSIHTPEEDWSATDAAFDRALDLQGAQLREFLAALPDQRRRHVQGLLDAVARGGPLDQPIGELAGALLGTAEAELEPRAAGRTIGGWRLLDRLGAGGMGVVYLAERADGHYEHRAALKVIRSELADEILVQRFLAERQILAQLSHPNIATLLDGGMTEDGLPYLVLELVDGRPIDSFCEEQGLALEQRVRLMERVCRAVDFAHRQLVVHRDLKPSNILVRPDGVPKLVDFGVAKLLDGSSVDEPTRFAPLTPRYAAPEQHVGGPVSIAADVWALGVVTAEVVLGEAPTAKGAIHESGAAVVAHPGLRGDLANIVGHALEPEPERRYRAAGELADDLERWLEGRPVQATRPTLWYRFNKLIRRHRAAAAAVVVAHLVAAAGLGGIVWQARQARIERDLARQEALRAEQVTAFLQGLFASAMPRVGGEPRVRDLLDQGATRIENDLSEAPAVRARLLETIGSAYKWLGELDRAEELLLEAERLQRSVSPGSEEHAVAVAALGGVLLARGEPGTAKARFLEALEILDGAGVGRNESRATLLNSLGMAELSLGNPEAAARWLRPSVEMFASGEDPGEAACRGNLGRALDRIGEHAAAEAEHRAALEIYRRTDADNATIATVLSNLAISLSSQGRLDEAVENIEQARLVWRQVPGSEAQQAEAEANFAYLLIVAGRAEAAVELAASAAAKLKELKPDATNTIATEANLGWALAMAGRSSEALPVLEGVVAALQERFGADHPVTARGRTRYGAALHRAGQMAAAQRQLERAVKALDPSTVSPVTAGDLLVAWAALCCDTGRADDGLRAAEDAVSALTEAHGAANWHVALARIERARCQAKLGREVSPSEVATDRTRVAAARGQLSWEAQRADRLAN